MEEVSKRERKKQVVKDIAAKLKSANIVAVIDLFNLPASLLQSVRKQTREDGQIIIEKTTMLRRALKEADKGKLLDFVEGQKALLCSSVEPFALYKKICGKPLPIYAKPGQIAPYDIVVPAGETVLSPGPVLSELKQAKIDARIAGGKIVIGKDSTVAKEGEKISDIVAKALQKLDIKPFELNVNVPIILEGDLLYARDILGISGESFMGMLSKTASEAFTISLEIDYPTVQNIKMLLQKAFREARTLGVERDVMLPDLMEEILKKAERAATALSTKVSS